MAGKDKKLGSGIIESRAHELLFYITLRPTTEDFNFLIYLNLNLEISLSISNKVSFLRYHSPIQRFDLYEQ